MHMQYYPLHDVNSELGHAKFHSLDTTSGFLQTLAVLLLTLAVSELICLFILQVISRVTFSFYADFPFPSFPYIFMAGLAPADDFVENKKQKSTLSEKDIDTLLVTKKWKKQVGDGIGGVCKPCNDSYKAMHFNHCAICLCDFGE